MEGPGCMGDLSTAHATPFYVCIHVPEFPTQARLRFRPEQAHVPVAVLDGDPPLEHVCSANAKALALGLTHGTTRTELDAFAGLTILRRSIEEERAARAALLSMAGTFTPRMQVCSGPSGSVPLVLVLDMTGTTRLFGEQRQTAQSLLQAVRALGLHGRLAASRNYYAAVCASRFADKAPILLEPGRETEGLSRLPLSALGLSAEQQSMFDLWGLRTLGELAALPEAELVSRLGQQGRRLRQLAHGEHPHLFVPEEPVFTLEEHIAFDSPEDRLDSLLFVLGPMLDLMLVRSQAYALALASVTVKLLLDGGGEHVRTVKPALPLAIRDLLLKLIQLDIEAHPPPAGVMAIHLHAEPGERSKVQAGLFSPSLPEPMRLDVTLARIAALVGEDRVGCARLRDTHNPEGFVMDRFAVPRNTPQQQQEVIPHTACRYLRPPVPLTLTLCEKKPNAFFFQGKRYSVSAAYGPWRRSGEWWSEAIWSREEWDACATAQDGETLLCILTQDLLQKSWHMQALYD